MFLYHTYDHFVGECFKNFFLFSSEKSYVLYHTYDHFVGECFKNFFLFSSEKSYVLKHKK